MTNSLGVESDQLQAEDQPLWTHRLLELRYRVARRLPVRIRWQGECTGNSKNGFPFPSGKIRENQGISEVAFLNQGKRENGPFWIKSGKNQGISL